MNNRDRAMKVWEYRFGNATSALDVCGAEIHKGAYDQVGSDYRWEIDHIVPVAKGGTDAYSNLRPLHFRNNDAKGPQLDGQNWRCAEGNKRYC